MGEILHACTQRRLELGSHFNVGRSISEARQILQLFKFCRPPMLNVVHMGGWVGTFTKIKSITHMHVASLESVATAAMATGQSAVVRRAGNCASVGEILHACTQRRLELGSHFNVRRLDSNSLSKMTTRGLKNRDKNPSWSDRPSWSQGKPINNPHRVLRG